MEAPQRALELELSLAQKLQRAAANLPCNCNGKWIPGVTLILQLNSIAVSHFTQTMYRALQLGARRGANVCCVGRGGCGKSSLLEPLEKIFDAVSQLAYTDHKCCFLSCV